MIILAVKIACLCVLVAGVETPHGIARNLFVAPRIGSKKANQYSIISGMLLAFLTCYFMVPQLGLFATSHLLAVGLILALFMASYDIALARWLMKQKWRTIRDHFNPFKGSFLIVGVLLLLLFPLIVMRLHHG